MVPLKHCWAWLLLAGFVCSLPSNASAIGTNKNSLVPPPRRDVPGRRAKLPIGTLYIPDFFKATNGTADVVYFFLGASWCAEQNFYDARKNGVLVSISPSNLAGLFVDTNVFPSVMAETTKTLKPEGVIALNRICLSSFSGGYSATWNILRRPEFAARISDVVLADSLYPKKTRGDPIEFDVADIYPILEFARRATESKTHFWFSQLFPPEEMYRNTTTTRAAYYLTDHLQVERRPTTETNSLGTKILYRAEKGNFHVLGYAGMTTQDHFNHFYGISDLWKQISFENAAPAKVP